MWQLAAKWTQKLPAELAHDTAVFALAHGLAPIADQILLPVRAAGLSFDNPLGLAAGFDKNAVASQALFGWALALPKLARLPRTRSLAIPSRACSACQKMVR